MVSASPLDDALAFQRQQTQTTFDAVGDATEEGIQNYFEALETIDETSSSMTTSVIDAYFAAIGPQGLAGATAHASDAAFTGYWGGAEAIDESGRGAEAGIATLVNGTGGNTVDVGDKLAQQIADATSGAGAQTGVLSSWGEAGAEAFLEASDSTFRGVGRLTEEGFQEYFRTADDAAVAMARSAELALAAYNSGTSDLNGALTNANDAAVTGYFGAVDAFGDATDSAGSAAVGSYFGLTGAAADAGYAATDSAIGSYFDAIAAVDSTSRSATSAAIGGYFAAAGVFGGLLKSGSAPLFADLYEYLVPCSPAEGGGFRVLDSGACVGQGFVGLGDPDASEGDEPGAPQGAQSQSDDGPSASGPATQGPHNPAPWNCSQHPIRQYGFEVRSGTRVLDRKCIQLITTGAGPGQFQQINRVDLVRLHSNAQTRSVTLDFTHHSNEVTAFTLVLGDTALIHEVGDSRMRLAGTVQFALSGVTVSLFSGTELAPTIDLRYTGGYADVAKFKFIPNKNRLTNYYLVEAGKWTQGAWSGQSTAPTTIKLSATLRNPSPNTANIDLDLTLDSPSGVKIVIGNGNDPMPFLADKLPTRTRLTNGEFYQRFDGQTAVYSRFKADLDIGDAWVPNLWVPLQGLDAQLSLVPSITGLKYEQVKVYATGSAELPCHARLVELIGDSAARGHDQVCVSGTPAAPNMAIYMEGGDVALKRIPAAPIQLAFGPLGGIAYTEVPTNAPNTGAAAELYVSANPKFGDVKSASITAMKSITFVPGSSVGGGDNGGSGGCGGTPLPANDKVEMVLEANFIEGIGEFAVSLGAGATEVAADFGQVTRILAQPGEGKLDIDFAKSGGRIRKLKISVVADCKPIGLTVDGANSHGLVSLRLSKRDGSSDHSPILLFDRLRMVTNGQLRFDAAGEIDGRGFKLHGRATRLSNGGYEGSGNLDIDGWYAGCKKKDGKFGDNSNGWFTARTDYWTYDCAVKSNILTYKLAPGVA